MEPHRDVHWPPGWGPEDCDSFVCHELLLAAPATEVFARLVSVADWPAWQRDTDRTVVPDSVEVGARFQVVALPHVLDAMIGELEPPARFGWAAVSDELSFYQTWLLVEGAGGGTRTIFHEAARGPGAVLQATNRETLAQDRLQALERTVTEAYSQDS